LLTQLTTLDQLLREALAQKASGTGNGNVHDAIPNVALFLY